MKAYADGEIKLGELPKDTPKSHIRHAPQFSPGDLPTPSLERSYTMQQVADFLGWVNAAGANEACRVAFATLEATKVSGWGENADSASPN